MNLLLTLIISVILLFLVRFLFYSLFLGKEYDDSLDMSELLNIQKTEN